MCRTCGCEATDPAAHDHGHDGHGHGPFDVRPRRTIALERDLLDKNDRLAEALRARFERDRIAAINVIGTPGAGKTLLLERSIPSLSGVPVAVIEGDQATDHDARRIAATGCAVVQVNTGAGCHLDAAMIERSLGTLALAPRSLLLIENVGNLVCPALFDLGERAKVVVMSITEGDDKPLKYPHVFRAAAAMVLSKIDLAPYLPADPARFAEHARRINPALEVFPVSATRGDGLPAWRSWLRARVEGAT